MTSPPPSDAEFSRKLALGILSILHQKGLLTSEEVDAILYTARRQAESAPPVQPVASPAALRARGPLSDPPRGPLSDPPRLRGPLSDPPRTVPAPQQEGASAQTLPSQPAHAAQEPAAEGALPEAEVQPAPLLPIDEPLDDNARTAEARWVRKEPLPPPTFDIEL